MSDDVKFCVNCRYFGSTDRIGRHVCLHQKSIRPSWFVTGGEPQIDDHYACDLVRTNGPCWPEGKLWEPIGARRAA